MKKVFLIQKIYPEALKLMQGSGLLSRLIKNMENGG